MSRRRSSRRNSPLVIVLVLTAVLLAVVGVLVSAMDKKNSGGRKQKADAAAEEEQDEDQGNDYITFEGKKYKYNYKLRNILFMGVDKTEEMKEETAGQGGQADSLILLVMNKEEKKTTLLEISRETMTEIKAYDIGGRYMGKEWAPITLQYAYGDGKKKSCQLTKSAVSSLLYEVPVHSYMALTVRGISIITDAIGGVELTVPEDYTDINPLFQKGNTVNLKGELAEQYVRKRDTAVLGSNSQRMNRQSQFLGALAKKIQKKGAEGKSWFVPVLPKIDPYMTTDITVDELEELAQYEMEEPIEIVPGKVQEGAEHDEFIVDNDELQKLVIKLFYIPA